jgi:hypothetical protein
MYLSNYLSIAGSSIKDEVRQSKMLSVVRTAMRHYVPLQEVKRLSNLQMVATISNSQFF